MRAPGSARSDPGSELALVPLRDTYINVCSAIAGVLYVTVKDQHPRGQGTVDIIITSEAGTATEDPAGKVPGGL